MNIYLTQLVDYLLTQSWQIAILTMVVALLAFLLRKKSAHVRYLLWLIVLAKCLVPPLYGVPLRVLPEDTLGARLLGVESHEVPGAAENARNADLPLEPLNTAEPQRYSFVIPESAVAGHTHVSGAQTLTWAETCYWLGLVWLAGMCAYLAFNMLRALRANRWLRRARRPLPIQSLAEIRKFFSAHGFTQLPKIWLVEDVSQPFVWGMVRGSIYLPADFLDINSLAQQHNTLAHELSHIVRFDAVVNLLQMLAQAIFWFHPVVWWANMKIRREREKCCDEMAVAGLGAQPKEYSMAVLETLVTPQESVHPVPSLAIAGPARNLEERIRVIMRPGKRFYLRPSLTAVTVVLVLAVLIVPGALVLTARAEETKTTSQSEEKSSQSVHQVVVQGNIEQVKRLIAQGVNVNAKDHSGWTPLHYVAKWRPHIEVHNLYHHDPKAMARIRKQAGILEMAKVLISNSAEVNIKDNKGNTPLHYAVEGGHKNVAELLITEGADVNARNEEGFTPIELFSVFEQTGVDRSLLANGADIPTIHVAALLGDLNKVKTFIDQDVPVGARGKAGSVDGTALLFAAHAGHKDVVKFLIDQGADVDAGILNGAGSGEIAQLLVDHGAKVNGNNNSGWPLRNAAGRGNIDVIRVLLANGADTEIKDGIGMTTLAFAAMAYKCKESTLFLIANGADVNTKDRWDRTPLHAVAALGWADVTQALIEKGADVNARNESGETPLHRAASNGHKEVTELLTDKGANPLAKRKAESDETPSDLALAGNHKEVVRVLAAKGATDIPEIYLAAYLGDVEKLRNLVNQTKDVEHKDKHGKTLLSYATLGGNTDIVQFLINENAKLDSTDEKGLTPLHYAALGNHEATVELLLVNGADINADSNEGTPLHMAIRLEGNPGMTDSDKTDMAELLVDKGADLNVCSQIAGTPLHFAVGRVQKNMVKLLIAKGAEVNAKGGEQVKGGTPLHAAVFNPYGDDVAEFLILGGADVNAKDDDGATLLHLCAQRRSRKPHTKLLLAHDADINARDNRDATPLHYAVESGRKDMAKLLVTRGADVNAKTLEGKTTLSLAKEKGHTEIVELLRKHGAKE